MNFNKTPSGARKHAEWMIKTFEFIEFKFNDARKKSNENFFVLTFENFVLFTFETYYTNNFFNQNKTERF